MPGTDIPTIHGRAIIAALPDLLDVEDWESLIAARWRPDRGWCWPSEGNAPVELHLQSEGRQ